MFEGLSAWFSSSVSRKVKKIWVKNGGRVTSVEDAQYIFSQDTESPDTQSIFESEAYLEEHLAVFHPNYIKECVKRGHIEQVTLGKYFFPPEDVQAIAREQLQYQWDLDGNTLDEDVTNSSDEEPTPPTRGLNKSKNQGSNNMAIEHSAQPPGCSKDTIQNQSNRSSEAHVRDKGSNVVHTQGSQSCRGESSGFVQSDNHKEHERKSPRRSSRQKENITESKSDRHDNSKFQTDSGHKHVSNEQKIKSSYMNKSVTGQTNARAALNNNCDEHKETAGSRIGTRASKKIGSENCLSKIEDINGSEIVRLEEMAKVTGDLQDFVVGKSGCELVKIC
ncbi:uncharacterized protein LOC123566446 [Mercenaria mercenaria]|uniref:uncharacterized protein LOC123566446 n=1 Tax=Mercenaria mercenaria TaxID=6596 RepID=UPI00234E457E|nr:uncharacterized protein LOC123566446 [Mercenaria mercenaria]XP_045216490.2 uncharacterized protein LOC123566446 [Mercenaria mercenaria]